MLQPHRQQRIALVQKLVDLGLSTEDIALVLGTKRGAIQGDRKFLGKVAPAMNRPSDRVRAFQHTFTLYAKLVTTGAIDTAPDLDKETCARMTTAFTEKFQIQDLRTWMTGVNALAEQLTDQISHQQENESLFRILRAIFRPRVHFFLDSPKRLFNDYLQEIAQGTVRAPGSLGSIKHELSKRYAAICRPAILPSQSPEVHELTRARVLKILDTLSEREEKLIKMRFGIQDGHYYTLDEVAAERGLSRDRIRQIEAQALRKLTHQSRLPAALPFANALSETGEQVLDRYVLATEQNQFIRQILATNPEAAKLYAEAREEAPRSMDDLVRPPKTETTLDLEQRGIWYEIESGRQFVSFSVILKFIDEPDIDMSVRAYNCLKNANLKTLGEIAVRTESDLLRSRNFGRKSLGEIKEALASHGLTLGMNIDLVAISRIISGT